MTACAVEVCNRAAIKRGWCDPHYNRWFRTGDAGETSISSMRRRGEPAPVCVFEGCVNRVKSNRLCKSHDQQRRRGQELRTLPMRGLTKHEEFLMRVDKTGNCWAWKAGKNAHGYGHFCHEGKVERAHRYSYRFYKGEIPANLVIDHMCRNRACVNPDHLQVVTQELNMQNLSLRSDNTSGHQGVTWDAHNRKWAASVTHDGRTHWCGRHGRLEDAARAALDKRNELHVNNLQDA